MCKILSKTQRIHNNSIPFVFSWFSSISFLAFTDQKSLEREITETFLKNPKEELLKNFNKYLEQVELYGKNQSH
jgi:hypothetical protein